MKTKVALGICSYGPQSSKFWLPYAETLAKLYNDDIEYDYTFWAGSVAVDLNRNNVIHTYLEESNAEWIWWIDSDNPPKHGALKRLLALGEPMVSGVYYSEFMNGEVRPIAYIRNKLGSYYTLDKVYKWKRGEILAVDAVGMGCCLIHRDIYLDIIKEHEIYERASGGIIALRKDQIRGEIPDKYVEHPYAGQVKNGVFYDPIATRYSEDTKFPFYVSQFNRTEDMGFCELVKSMGYGIWLDTGVESGHVKDKTWTGEDYRDQYRPDPAPQEIEDV